MHPEHLFPNRGATDVAKADDQNALHAVLVNGQLLLQIVQVLSEMFICFLQIVDRSASV
jgi:hypothetical protein